MASPIDLVIRISAQSQAAVRGMQGATTAAERFRSAAKGMAVAGGIAIGGLVALGKGAAEAASRQSQAFGSLESVYGKNSATVKAWAAQSASTVGLSSAQYAEMAAKLGASLKNMGLSQDQAGQKSKDLISLGADLSAAFGGSSADAVDALGAALRGEADPAERYGLALSQTAINAELAKRGQNKLTGAALQSAKAQAILELATKQAGGAIGQFARENGTAAGSAQIAAAQFENAKASLGQALLPVLVAVSAAVQGFSAFLQQNIGLVTGIGIAVGVFAGALIAVNAGMAIYNGVQKIMAAATAVSTAAQWLWNAALSANPIGLVVLAIAAFVAAIVVLWNKSTGFRNFILAMWRAIQAAAAACWQAIKTAVSAVINAVTSAARGLGNAVAAVWNGIKSSASAVWNFIADIVRGVVQTVTRYWSAFVSGFGALIGGIKAAASNVFNGVKAIVQGVVDGIKAVIGTIVGIATGVWNTVKSGAQTVWQGIKAVIIDPLQAAYDWVSNVFGSIAGFFSGLWNGIVDTARSILGGIGDAVSSAFGAVGGVIKGVINGIISFINNTVIWGINKLIDGANLIPWVDIPHVSNIPLIGSAEPQLDALTNALAMPYGAGATYININGAVDPESVGRQLQAILTGRDRRHGVVTIGGAAWSR